MMEEEEDICRVCRATGSPDRPLFHPCICTGSIRHVHQDCLVQWLRHSRKDHCELCKHKYTFKPIYSPDMPNHLPIHDLAFGLMASIYTAIKYWIHYTMVALAWLAFVPLTSYRIYKCVFAGSVSALTSLPRTMVSFSNIPRDIFLGYGVVACTMIAFIGLIWLRVQILNGELPAWLIPHPRQQQHNRNVQPHNGERNNNQENEDEDNNNNANGLDLQPNPPVNVQNPGNNNDNNWNALDWERGVEDHTWERILGLDGSMLFVEHVLWVVALNTLVILVFAFCPYHLGHFFMLTFNLNHYVLATKFEGVLTSVCGYILVALGFLLGHIIMQLAKIHWPIARLFGVGYIILKVGLLFLVELGVFPLLCGVWIDICSLKAFNSTLEIRKEKYFESPRLFLFLHWIIGIVFVFYLAHFLMLLREVVRPGVLWFLRNLNDPNFNPINEMIHLPVFKHLRRFLFSIVIFGSTIIAVAWMPGQILRAIAPSFLPLNAAMNSTSPVGEFPMQLFVFQLIISGLVEQNGIRSKLKAVVKWCADVISRMLGIRSYLIGDVVPNQIGVDGENDVNAFLENQRLVQAGLDRGIPVHQPYFKPKFFTIRIILLLAAFVGTLALAFTAILSIPIFIGRHIVKEFFGPNGTIHPLSSDSPYVVYDLYTFLVGFYVIFGCIRVYRLLATWEPRGWGMIKEKILIGLRYLFKGVVLAAIAIIILPLLLGLAFDLTVLLPLRVSLYQSPVFVLWQNWAIGIFVLKVCVGCLLLGPQTRIQRDIEHAYHQGIVALDLLDFIRSTVMPIVFFLLSLLIIPYAIGHTVPLLVECDLQMRSLFRWRAHSVIIILYLVLQFCWYEVKQFKRLCERIKNERYLIGRKLEDYEPQPTGFETAS